LVALAVVVKVVGIKHLIFTASEPMVNKTLVVVEVEVEQTITKAPPSEQIHHVQAVQVL
jgi:hypothetical protein